MSDENRVNTRDWPGESAVVVPRGDLLGGRYGELGLDSDALCLLSLDWGGGNTVTSLDPEPLLGALPLLLVLVVDRFGDDGRVALPKLTES